MSILIVVDVEAVGTSPFSGEMTEFGAVALSPEGIVGKFEGVLIEEAGKDPNNPAIPLIRPDSPRHDLKEVMEEFAEWAVNWGGRPIFVSDNPAYDFQWINYAFDKAGVSNPFGWSGRRIGDFWAGLNNNWKNTQKWKKYRKTTHTHKSIDDALGNAEALLTIFSLGKEL